MGTIAALVAAIAIAAAGQAPTATVAGRVTEQASGRPVPRVVVAAIAAGGRVAADTLTDADGRNELPGLPAGAYAVNVSNDEHRSTYLSQWFGDTTPASGYGLPARLNVELKPGERRAGMDVAVTRALAIEGQVLDPWGDPMTDVEVTVSG